MLNKFLSLILPVFLSASFSCFNKTNSISMEEGIKARPIELKNGNLTVSIDPQTGGRITSFRLGTDEMLIQNQNGLTNYGSTFWTAPQSDWNWPPFPALHQEAYTIVKQNKNYLEMESSPNAPCGFQVKKIFRFGKNDNLEITYELKNISKDIKKAGPWEITVVPAGGLTLFPNGSKNNLKTSTLSFNQNEKYQFFFYDDQVLQNQQKLFAFPKEGWLGHLNPNNLLFIKKIDIFSSEEVSPTHGLVEVYISKKSKYMELENHGKYQQLKPNESLKYRVNWYLKKLDGEFSTEINIDSIGEQISEIIQ